MAQAALASSPHIDFSPFHISTSLLSTNRLPSFPHIALYINSYPRGLGIYPHLMLGGRWVDVAQGLAWPCQLGVTNSIDQEAEKLRKSRDLCPVHSLLIHCASISDVSPTLVTSPCPPIRMNNVSLPIETARSPKWFLGHAQDTVEANCPL